MTTHLAPALGWPLMTHILTSHPNTAKIHTHFLRTRPLIPLMWAGIRGELMDATVDSDTVGSMISGASPLTPILTQAVLLPINILSSLSSRGQCPYKLSVPLPLVGISSCDLWSPTIHHTLLAVLTTLLESMSWMKILVRALLPTPHHLSSSCLDSQEEDTDCLVCTRGTIRAHCTHLVHGKDTLLAQQNFHTSKVLISIPEHTAYARQWKNA